MISILTHCRRLVLQWSPCNRHHGNDQRIAIVTGGACAPMFGTRLPRYRTRSGAFDDMVAAQIRRLNGAWPQLVKPVQFAVEDVPPSQPAPWEPEPSFASQCFPASHGIPARIVLYRMPIQSKSRSRMDLELAIRDEVVLRLAELYGRRPDEIDPDWSL